jgi:maltooligosyltrehalose trehalohydrolase
VFSQNHDQVGNRADGARLSAMLDFERLKLAAAAVILSGDLPMLFMGEEYAETAPFQYFVSHSDPALIEAVRRGRRAEFASFGWQGAVPDPQAEETFTRSKLHHELKHEGRHAVMLAYYRELLRLRHELHDHGLVPACAPDAAAGDGSVVVRYRGTDTSALLVLNFADNEGPLELPRGSWQMRLDSADERWDGPGGCARAGASITMRAHQSLLFTAHEGT